MCFLNVEVCLGFSYSVPQLVLSALYCLSWPISKGSPYCIYLIRLIFGRIEVRILAATGILTNIHTFTGPPSPHPYPPHLVGKKRFCFPTPSISQRFADCTSEWHFASAAQLVFKKWGRERQERVYAQLSCLFWSFVLVTEKETGVSLCLLVVLLYKKDQNDALKCLSLVLLQCLNCSMTHINVALLVFISLLGNTWAVHFYMPGYL